MNPLASLPIIKSLQKSILLVNTDVPYGSHKTIHLKAKQSQINNYFYKTLSSQTDHYPQENIIKNITETPLDEFDLQSNISHFIPTTLYNHTGKIIYLETTKKPKELEANTGIIKSLDCVSVKKINDSDIEYQEVYTRRDLDFKSSDLYILDFLNTEEINCNNVHLVFQNKIKNQINIVAFLVIVNLLSSPSMYNLPNISNKKPLQAGTIDLSSLNTFIHYLIQTRGKKDDQYLIKFLDKELFFKESSENFNEEELKFMSKIYNVFSFLINNIFNTEEKSYIFSIGNIDNYLIPNDKQILLHLSDCVPDANEDTQEKVNNIVIVFTDISDRISEVSNLDFISNIKSFLLMENEHVNQ